MVFLVDNHLHPIYGWDFPIENGIADEDWWIDGDDSWGCWTSMAHGENSSCGAKSWATLDPPKKSQSKVSKARFLVKFELRIQQSWTNLPKGLWSLVGFHQVWHQPLIDLPTRSQENMKNIVGCRLNNCQQSWGTESASSGMPFLGDAPMITNLQHYEL